MNKIESIKVKMVNVDMDTFEKLAEEAMEEMEDH